MNFSEGSHGAETTSFSTSKRSVAKSTEVEGLTSCENSPYILKQNEFSKIIDKIRSEFPKLLTQTQVKLLDMKIDENSFYNLLELYEKKRAKDSTLCRVKLSFHDWEVIMEEYSSAIHEVIASSVNMLLISYNISHSGSGFDPFIVLGSPTTKSSDGNIFEADTSLVNKRAILANTISRDLRNAWIPTIVTEVAVVQTLSDMTATSEEYLRNEHVRLVLSFRMSGKRDVNNLFESHSLFYMVYMKNEAGVPNLVRVINLSSRRLDHNIINAIESTTTFPAAGIEGVGFTCQTGYPLPENNIFCVTVPFHIMWYKVPEDQIDHSFPEMRLDLAKVVNECRAVTLLS